MKSEEVFTLAYRSLDELVNLVDEVRNGLTKIEPFAELLDGLSKSRTQSDKNDETVQTDEHLKKGDFVKIVPSNYGQWLNFPCEVVDYKYKYVGNVYLMPLKSRPDGYDKTNFIWDVKDLVKITPQEAVRLAL